ncbi:nucleotidyltransferase family protein [Methanospirillum stamsii]|uniref:protein adenylyltransferase n=1 Tax=Methanospirillum stamsii TaxID=1277351 RepID=A0A2V2N2U0_9EURY|nr:nucleotidyltransferase family protein [Methanospirillum stamsii]PWR70838.1 hypothetical protein DLD82_15240 [Methanospirillum stamsii]
MNRVDTCDEIRDIINLHRKNLQKKYHITRIGIFGSAARNDLKDTSDIDILVEFDQSVGFFLMSHLQNEMRLLLGRDVDLTTPGALHPLLRSSIMEDIVYV